MLPVMLMAPTMLVMLRALVAQVFAVMPHFLMVQLVLAPQEEMRRLKVSVVGTMTVTRMVWMSGMTTRHPLLPRPARPRLCQLQAVVPPPRVAALQQLPARPARSPALLLGWQVQVRLSLLH